jgi:hypothetical protein
MTEQARRLFHWCFRNRETGRTTIAQVPNVPLAIAIVLGITRRLASPAGTAGTVLDVAVAAAVTWWAGDEIVRGVNPWRRALGAVVLVITLVGLVTT